MQNVCATSGDRAAEVAEPPHAVAVRVVEADAGRAADVSTVPRAGVDSGSAASAAIAGAALAIVATAARRRSLRKTP